MARIVTRNSRPAYDLVQRWLLDVLPAEGALFEPSTPVWTPDRLDELVRDFVGNPHAHGDNFTEKLAAQLATVSDDAVRLMAEVESISYLIHWVGATTQKRKLEVIRFTLALRNLERVTVPESVREALTPGFCHPGQYLNSSPNKFFEWVILFARLWQRLDNAERTAATTDPWAFRELTEQIDGADGVAMAIRHLAHPDTFEPIVTPNDMDSIVARWSPSGVEHDRDRALLDIRMELTPKWGENFTWYDQPLKQLWKPSPEWSQFIEWGARVAKAIRLNDAERDYKVELAQKAAPVRQLVDAGDPEWLPAFRSAWISNQNNLVDWMRRDNVMKWAEADPDAAREFLTLLWADEPRLDDAMRAWPDSVPGNPGVRLNVTSTLLMLKNPGERPPVKITALKNALELAGWSLPDQDDPMTLLDWAYDFFDAVQISLADRDVDLRDRLDAQGLVWTMLTLEQQPDGWSDTDWSEFQAFRGGEVVTPEPPQPSDDPVQVRPDIVDSLADAADDLSVPLEKLEEMDARLRHKRQVVLYGPPGTGKTYFARRFARAVARGNADAVQVVQFHPSTTYEDFVEGIRPRTVDGELRYELVDGPIKRMAAEADRNPGQDFVLVIDELNRANLPKVFGELLYLLEYRKTEGGDDGVRLLYRPDETFVLPTNLFIVATMNTADRSVALIDAAVRRRFEFFAFFPDREPVKGMLRTWLSKHENALPVADFLEAVNERLAAEGLPTSLLLGPSYVMGGVSLSLDSLEKAWRYAIYPTLEELFWGKDDVLEFWTWERVLQDFAPELGLKPAEESADGDAPVDDGAA